MKISNIIILSMFVLVMIFATIGFFQARNDVKEHLQEEKTEETKERVMQTLDNFHSVVLSDKTKVLIKQAGKNEASFNSSQEMKKYLKVENDTLFISGETDKFYLNVQSLKSINLNKEAELILRGLNADTLSIILNDNAELKIDGLTNKYLNIVSNNNSEFKIYDSYINTVNVDAKDMSELFFGCKTEKITGHTESNTEVKMTGVKIINLNAEGEFSISNSLNMKRR